MALSPARTGFGSDWAVSLPHGLRVLDSILVVDRTAWGAVPAGVIGDATTLWLAGNDPIDWTRGDRRVTCPAGGAILLDGVEGMTGGEDGILLILRQRPAPALAVNRTIAHILAPSTSLHALRSLASAWLVSDACLSDGQTRLAGRAVGELAAAALLPLAAPSVGDRRKTSLLDRIIAHIDGHFVETLDAPKLCKALSCSRSALYRAARPMGGVVTLVKQRRLAAVYDRLRDPAEQASVGELARINGFDDQTQFSRSFKRRYGRTAGAVRDASRPVAQPIC